MRPAIICFYSGGWVEGKLDQIGPDTELSAKLKFTCTFLGCRLIKAIFVPPIFLAPCYIIRRPLS